MNPLNFLVLRNMREQILRAARIVKDAPGAPRESIERDTAITLPPSLVRPENRKRYAVERDPATIDYLVGHVTDVTGGFGVQKWGPDGWKTWGDRRETDDVPFGLLCDMDRVFGQAVGGPARMKKEDWGEVFALCSRYAQLSYHRGTSRKLGEFINRPMRHRTKASGEGNGGVALAMDMGHKEEIDSAFARAGRQMVRRAYFDLRDAGSDGPIAMTMHGNFARDRWNDAGRICHLTVFRPAVLTLRAQGHDIFTDYERAVGGGRALTTRDDPDAHFDTKGRRVRTKEGTPL